MGSRPTELVGSREDIQLETNYRYMIHYLVEGKKDPDQQKIYFSRLVRGIYLLADDLCRNSGKSATAPLFFRKGKNSQYQATFVT